MDCSLSASSPWDSPGKNTGVDRFSLLQRLFPTQGSNLDLCHYRWILYHLSHPGIPKPSWKKWKCSHCHVCLFVTTWTVACQVPLSMGFSRKECWSWLPLTSLGNLPDPEIEPTSPEVKVQSPNHWDAREFLSASYFWGQKIRGLEWSYS